MLKVSAEIKALEKKEERTAAEDQRLEQLQSKKEAMEKSFEGMSMGDARTLSEMEAKIRGFAPMAAGLRAANLSPREYAKFTLAMMQAGMVAGLKKSGLVKELPKDVSAENVKFVEERSKAESEIRKAKGEMEAQKQFWEQDLKDKDQLLEAQYRQKLADLSHEWEKKEAQARNEMALAARQHEADRLEQRDDRGVELPVLAADRGFKVETGHPEGGVAHEVHAEFLRRGELGAHNQAQAGSQSMGFSPADVAAWRRSLIEGNELVAWAAGVVGDNHILAIEPIHEFPHDPIGVDRFFIGRKLRHPLRHPFFFALLDLRGDRSVFSTVFIT